MKFPWLAVLAASCLLAGRAEEPAAADQVQPRLRPVHWQAEGKAGFTTEAQYGFSPAAGGPVAFRAVLGPAWPPGLSPVFQVEKNGALQLRRRPPRGQENITEPLFFALPPELEMESAKIAGHWRCEALRADGTKAYPDFEIATEGNNVAARFDQNTEYRFAFMSGGTFLTNGLTLRVEYISEQYELTGRFASNRLSGSWKRVQGLEHGNWQAERTANPLTAWDNASVAPLYEWRRGASDVTYTLGDAHPGPGWSRSAQPLCRVWKP